MNVRCLAGDCIEVRVVTGAPFYDGSGTSIRPVTSEAFEKMLEIPKSAPLVRLGVGSNGVLGIFPKSVPLPEGVLELANDWEVQQ